MKKMIILITLIMIAGLFSGCIKLDFSESENTAEKEIEHNNIMYRIDGDEAIISDIINPYKNIHIPEKVSSYPVTDIDDSCWFGYLSEERSLTVDAKNQYFYDDGKALYSRDKTKLYYVHNYYSYKEKESYNLSENVKWIRQNAFEYFRQKVTVDSENKYFCVYDDALYDYDMKRLIYYFSDSEILNIPGDVEEIEEIVLDYKYISKFNVDTKNKFFASKDGILFRFGMKELVRCPRGIEISDCIIPEGTITIENGAFWGCHNVNSIYLPDSILKIQSKAFGGCRYLFTLSVPKTIEFIGGDILIDSAPEHALINVLYRGSDEDYEKTKRIYKPLQKDARILTMDDEAYERYIDNFGNVK